MRCLDGNDNAGYTVYGPSDLSNNVTQRISYLDCSIITTSDYSGCGITTGIGHHVDCCRAIFVCWHIETHRKDVRFSIDDDRDDIQ